MIRSVQEYTLVNVALELFAVAMLAILLIVVLRGISVKVYKRRQILFSLMLISSILMLLFDAFLNGFRFNPTSILFRTAQLLGNAVFFLSMSLSMHYLRLLASDHTRTSPLPSIIIDLLCLTGTVQWTATCFTGGIITYTSQGFEKGPCYILGQIPGYLVMVISTIMILHYSRDIGRTETATMLLYIIIPLTGAILHYLHPSLMIHYPAIALSLLIVYLTVHSKREGSLRIDLQKMRSEILVHQMNPHFTFNVLNAIYYLCEKDAALAQKCVGEFSEYLRKNIDDFTIQGNVAFEWELEHIGHYLSIQKLRFGEELKIIYDIQRMNFRIPPMTVEPLVENAVQHGLSKKPGGGTIRIMTREKGGQIRITVQDDGVGFDTKHLDEIGTEHIGLRNVRYRIEQIPGAMLELVSREGWGTKAEITVPGNMTV